MDYQQLKTIISNAQCADLESLNLMGDYVARSDVTQEQRQELMTLLNNIPVVIRSQDAP